eukprot:8322109-Alexandrium_andersonii.AAC.1
MHCPTGSPAGWCSRPQSQAGGAMTRGAIPPTPGGSKSGYSPLECSPYRCLPQRQPRPQAQAADQL